MNYEEKLRLAKEALASSSYNKETIEYIFPELKENEDEKIRKCLTTIIKIQKEGSFGLECNHGASWNEMLSWLEKQGEQKPEWSDDDEEMLKDIISGLNAQKLSIFAHDNQGKAQMNQRIDWLQSLPERFNLQPKQEWSEEDEHCIELLLPIIDSSSLIPKNRKKCKEFLKSLKPSHWKPSKEQMEALDTINNIGELSYVEQSDLLVRLYNDLKKL